MAYDWTRHLHVRRHNGGEWWYDWERLWLIRRCERLELLGSMPPILVVPEKFLRCREGLLAPYQSVSYVKTVKAGSLPSNAQNNVVDACRTTWCVNTT